MTTGFPRQAAMVLEVNGLNTIKRFTGKPVKLDQKLLAKIDADNLRRAAAKEEASAKKYAIKKMAKTPKLDGNANDWGELVFE